MQPSSSQIGSMEANSSDDRRAWFLGVNAMGLVIVYTAIGLRFLSRHRAGTSIGYDDWLICLAVVLVTGHISCLIVTVHFGMGRHVIHVTNAKGFALTSLVAQTFYNLCVPTIKLSILALYARIFRRTAGWFTPTLYITAIFVFICVIPQVMTYIFQCVPIYSLWEEAKPGALVYCINFRAAIICFGVLNIVTDWWILALPVPVITGLRMDRRTKWSLCALFSLGGFVCVVSVIRLIYAKNVATVDPSWDYTPISLISSLECCFGILAACMPTYRPLIKFLRHGITSYFSNQGKSSRSNLTYGNVSTVGIGGLDCTHDCKSSMGAAVRSPPRSHSPGRERVGIVDKIFHPRSRRGKALSTASDEKILTRSANLSNMFEMIHTPSSSTTSPKLSAERTSKARTSTPTQPNSRSGSAMGLRDDGCEYQVHAGADRWEGMMQQQRRKNERDHRNSNESGRDNEMKASYGGVAYGGKRVSVRRERSREPSRERLGAGVAEGLEGWDEGIVVTTTVQTVGEV